MKILKVVPNNRKHRFDIRCRRHVFVFPYAKLDPAPSSEDRVVDVFVDPEFGGGAFTYVLESGAEGSVHVDAVLEYNEDPSYMAELALYRLTLEAKQRIEDSGLSIREIARALRTSPTQIYRLLDPTNYTKSSRQLISLLYVLGCDVNVTVTKRASKAAS